MDEMEGPGTLSSGYHSGYTKGESHETSELPIKNPLFVDKFDRVNAITKREIETTIICYGLNLSIDDIPPEHYPIFNIGKEDLHVDHDAVRAVRSGDYNHFLESRPRTQRPRKETMVACLLALVEQEKTIVDETEFGKKLDTALMILSLTASTVKLDKPETLALTSFLMKYRENHSPGLSEFSREDLIDQTLQFLAARSPLGLMTLADSTDGKSFLSCDSCHRERLMDYFINGPEKLDEGDALLMVLALTCPYTMSLGLSSIGQRNLDAFTLDLTKLFKLVNDKLEASPAKDLAMYLILKQLYHCEGKISTDNLEICGQKTRDRLVAYQDFRSKQPLWMDKMVVFRQYSSNVDTVEKLDKSKNQTYLMVQSGLKQIVERVKVKKAKPVIGLSLKGHQLISFLDSGQYLTLYEAFSGNGCNYLTSRLYYERRLGINSTGTPDDPYVRYGAVRIYSSRSFTIDRARHYGSYTLVLKDEVLETRTSATPDDSFEVFRLPVVGKDSIQQIALKNMDPYSISPYTEAQVHGGVLLDDVKLIVVSDEVSRYDPIFREVVRRATEHGIRVIFTSEI